MKTISNRAAMGVAGCLLIGMAATVAVQHRSFTRLRAQNQSLQRQLIELSAQAEQLTIEKEQLSKVLAAGLESPRTSLTSDQSDELLRLRGAASRLSLQDRVEAQSRREEMEAAQARLAKAETELARLTQLRSEKLISEQEFSRAKFDVELLKAEAKGDKAAAARIRLEHAEEELARATELRSRSLISQAEYDAAANKADLLRAGQK